MDTIAQDVLNLPVPDKMYSDLMNLLHADSSGQMRPTVSACMRIAALFARDYGGISRDDFINIAGQMWDNPPRHLMTNGHGVRPGTLMPNGKISQ